MADNERVQYDLSDKEYYLQDAPAQANRTDFTPGKTGESLDENWPKEFNVKTGNPTVDASEMQHIRVLKTGRAVLCDQTIPAPEVLGSTVTTCTDDAGGVEGTHTFKETKVQINNGIQERNTGSENVKP